ncbi:Uncharacterized protein GBIM_15599 [Gryllus bimaculatus]|nr:Uncharacterized protein GBIM_15599 [Gryllus bimaculatus]
MFSVGTGDAERHGSPLYSTNGNLSREKKKNQNTPYSPVVMVLQPRSSPNYTTPLRCKDFYCSSNAVCRICHEEDSPESLISPCNCMGSLGRMHRKCLEKWLSMSNSDRCEICKYRFHVTYRTRHIGQWLLSDGVMGPKCFLGDMICLLVLLPLSIMSVYLCAFAAHSYMNKHEWQATGLALLCLILLIAFVIWSGLTFRFHYLRFRDWQRSNLIVQVIVSPKVQHSIETKNEERTHNTPENHTSVPEADLDYSIDVNALALSLNSLGMVETRL